MHIAAYVPNEYENESDYNYAAALKWHLTVLQSTDFIP